MTHGLAHWTYYGHSVGWRRPPRRKDTRSFILLATSYDIS